MMKKKKKKRQKKQSMNKEQKLQVKMKNVVDGHWSILMRACRQLCANAIDSESDACN